MNIKTIDVIGKEWFDKVNGNSYFSARITINYAMNDEKTIVLPFQYGYGDSYLDRAFEELKKLGIVNINHWYFSQCKEQGIILRCYKIENCLKKDVKEWGIE